MPKPRTSPLDRVLNNCVETPLGCWEFRGYIRPNGYGSVGSSDGSRKFYTHRLTYSFFINEIPEGLVIDHLCRNRACCNPWHLEPVTQMVNVHRGEGHSSETHCPQGHPYDEANTRRSRGKRYCKACLAAKRGRVSPCPRCGKSLTQWSIHIHLRGSAACFVGPKSEVTPKTHCTHGHAMDADNTYLRPDGGSPSCRACNRLRVAEYKARKIA